MITSPFTFNADNIVIYDDKTMDCYGNRILRVCIRHLDGSIGPILLPLPKVFSYGIEPFHDFSSKEKRENPSFSLSLVFSGENSNNEIFLSVYEQVVKKCYNHVTKNIITDKVVPEYHNLNTYEKNSMTKLYQKTSLEQEPKKQKPYHKFYPRIISKNGNFLSKFYNVKNDSILNPRDLIGKNFFVTCGTIIIDHILIHKSSHRIFLRPSLYDANVEFIKEKPRLAGTFYYD